MNEKPKRGPGRPPAPMKADPKERQTAIRIRPEVYTALRVESDRHGVTMVAMLNDVLRYWSLAGAATCQGWKRTTSLRPILTSGMTPARRRRSVDCDHSKWGAG